MKISDRKIKLIIKENNLVQRENIMRFIAENPMELSIEELSRIAELVNNERADTSAYYTDSIILQEIFNSLPEIDKKVIKILEPSVGIGNFLQIIIDKYSSAQKLIIEVNDIDENSLELLKMLHRYRNIPKNVEFIYSSVDYVSPIFYNTDSKYDLIIGNPPFTKLNKKKNLLEYSNSFGDDVTNNLAGFFLQKSIELADHIMLIMPKYFLSNPDFSLTRERVASKKIEKIIDFGEKGFNGVLIETVGILIDTTTSPDFTECFSVTRNIKNEIKQEKMTSPEFPYWILYRNCFFEEIADHMKFDVFTVFRDRQITNSKMKEKGEIPVIKSRNILRDGSGFISIDNYDSFINREELNTFTVGKYFDREDVFLSPNMTYYPRVIKKPKGIVVNGSVAILEPKKNVKVEDRHLRFLSSSTFEEFYKIARNYSTRSLNIDSNSVKFFGLYTGSNF